MLYRLVRAMQRSRSRNRYYVKRIPADLKNRTETLRANVPIGSEYVPINITCATETVRVSLRTADPVEAKARLAQVAEYFDFSLNLKKI